ncbi:hypothetical protein Zmor_007105 [Zophobas morio]|uniref:Uncharacterized protein n=1 Tax=Zophobas morio TaxID=2755281 RepID=A0AA38IWS0_9CUCU|nr:hypothetical protein Zmor_007105 [Zophobas morio]
MPGMNCKEPSPKESTPPLYMNNTSREDVEKPLRLKAIVILCSKPNKNTKSRLTSDEVIFISTIKGIINSYPTHQKRDGFCLCINLDEPNYHVDYACFDKNATRSDLLTNNGIGVIDKSLTMVGNFRLRSSSADLRLLS